MIATFARYAPDAFVIQVGSHDGTALDPLRTELLRRQWRGILIEPVPYVFDRLRANYSANPRLILENAAIADIDGLKDFHHLARSADDSLWIWYDALGSFRRDVVLRHSNLIPDIADRLVTTPVPCMTFETLCQKHGVEQVDIIQIDTEGYDFEILRLIDLRRWHPSLLMYEHLHLSPSDRAAARALLDNHGYVRLADDMDTLGVSRLTLTRIPQLGQLYAALVEAGAGDAA